MAVAKLDSALTDRELLDAFVRRGEQGAFALLVERLGPMVLGTCRRILREPHDAEDAFQATFLALARQAKTIRGREAVAAWLYGVAYRIALQLRAGLGGRRERERRAAIMPGTNRNQPDPVALVVWRELRPVLDEELARLPDKYRAPLVLCYLDGKTHEEAARELGWRPGSMSKRLARAKELLRSRLARRGLSLSTGLLFGALSEHAARAALPAALVQAAVRAGKLASATQAALAAEFSARVIALQQGAVKMMLLTRLKPALVFLALSTLVGGTALFAYQAGVQKEIARQPRPAEDKPKPPAAEDRPAETAPARMDLHGDPLPPGAIARMGSVRFRHGDEAVAVTFAPGGKTFASASHDGTVRLWETATGKELRRFTDDGDHKGPVAFSPDGKILAAASWNGPVRLWDVATGKEIRRFGQSLGGSMCLAFSPDGKTLAARVRDSMTGKDNLTLWDVATGKELRRLEGHTGDYVYGVAFSRDGQTLASSGQDGTIRLWDTATGKELHQFKYGARQVAFSPTASFWRREARNRFGSGTQPPEKKCKRFLSPTNTESARSRFRPTAGRSSPGARRFASGTWPRAGRFVISSGTSASSTAWPSPPTAKSWRRRTRIT